MTKIKTIVTTSIDSLGTTKKIIQKGEIKKTYLHNKKNKTNYYTIIKEVKNDNEFSLFSKLEVGDVYNVYFRFNFEGDIVYERKFNKIKKITEKKELFLSTNKGTIHINEYKKEKTISFKITKDGKKEQ